MTLCYMIIPFNAALDIKTFPCSSLSRDSSKKDEEYTVIIFLVILIVVIIHDKGVKVFSFSHKKNNCHENG